MAKEKLVTFSPSLEFFSVRQFWHFCQYCVKYLLLIIVQIEKCYQFDKENTEAKMLKYVIMKCSCEIFVT